MKKQFDYEPNVVDNVIEFFKENFNQEISEQDVLEMEPEEVLNYYLEWEGIIGYTEDIIEIMKQK